MATKLQKVLLAPGKYPSSRTAGVDCESITLLDSGVVEVRAGLEITYFKAWDTALGVAPKAGTKAKDAPADPA